MKKEIIVAELETLLELAETKKKDLSVDVAFSTYFSSREIMKVSLFSTSSVFVLLVSPFLIVDPISNLRAQSSAESTINPQSDMELECAIVPNSHQPGDPADEPWIEFQLRNAGSQIWWLSRDSHFGGLTISMTDENGKKEKPTKYGEDYFSDAVWSTRRPIKLQSNDLETATLPIGRLFNLKPNHKYHIEITWKFYIYKSEADLEKANRTGSTGIKVSLTVPQLRYTRKSK